MPIPIRFDDLQINNFKNFSFLDFKSLSQINLITGRNNAGKTSLLESLYLCLGPANPELIVNILVRRAVLANIAPSVATYLYHNLDLSKKIIFTYKESGGKEYKLQIQNVEKKSYSIPQSRIQRNADTGKPEYEDLSDSTTLKEIFTGNNKEKSVITEVTITPNRIFFSGQKQTIFSESVFLSTALLVANPAQDAIRYSNLNKLNGIQEFDKHLRVIEPSLLRTSLITEATNTYVAGDVGYGLVPLSLLGEGTNKLSTILLAISNSKDACCLIDEIENGFHYSIYPKLWESVTTFSQNYNCQVFCTTHSKECIQGAYNIFQDSNDSTFRLHRLLKTDSRTEIITYDQSEFKTAVETDWDIR